MVKLLVEILDSDMEQIGDFHEIIPELNSNVLMPDLNYKVEFRGEKKLGEIYLRMTLLTYDIFNKLNTLSIIGYAYHKIT